MYLFCIPDYRMALEWTFQRITLKNTGAMKFFPHSGARPHTIQGCDQLHQKVRMNFFNLETSGDAPLPTKCKGNLWNLKTCVRIYKGGGGGGECPCRGAGRMKGRGCQSHLPLGGPGQGGLPPGNRFRERRALFFPHF